MLETDDFLIRNLDKSYRSKTVFDDTGTVLAN